MKRPTKRIQTDLQNKPNSGCAAAATPDSPLIWGSGVARLMAANGATDPDRAADR